MASMKRFNFSVFCKQHNPVRPYWIVLFLFGLLLVGGVLAGCNGGGEGSVASGAEGSTLADPVAAEGETLFKQNCASCHSVNGNTIIVGPSLAGVASRAGSRIEGLSAAEYIQLSILRPGEYVVEGFPDLMPTTFGTNLSGEELDAIIAYLLTLE